MRLIASTISEVPASPSRPWKDRIVLGIWATKYLPLAHEYLPGFSLTHIGFSTTYSRQFLSVPNVSFNMLNGMLIGPFGASFIRDAKALHRPTFAWTVNRDNMMKWCIRKGLDGVYTDDPKRFLEVCEEWERDHEKEKFAWSDWFSVLRIHALVSLFVLYFRYKFGSGVDKRFIRRPSIGEE
jgi:hypothetical protein